jgi:hypothetical protein
MAFKIYASGNYVYIENTLTGDTIDGGKNDVFFDRTNTPQEAFDLRLKSRPLFIPAIALADMVDENNAPYTSQSFKTFKEANTGFNTAGGGSPAATTPDQYADAYEARVTKENGTFESRSSLLSILNKIDSAGLLQTTTYLLTPNAVKPNKTFAIFPEIGAGDMVTTRNSLATRTNSAGNRVSDLANVHRLDYELSSNPSGFFESQSTNLLLNSATVQNQTINITGAQHTLSFYGTGRINLSGVASGSLVGTGLNDLASLTFTPTVGGVLTIGGTGVRTEGQLEIGSEATSRIVTAGVSVTRVTDSGAKNDLAYLLGQTEGTLFARISRNTESASVKILSLGDGTSDNFIVLGFGSNNNLRLQITIDSQSIISSTSISSLKNQFYNVLLSYKSGDFAVWVDGVEVATSTATPTFSGTFNDLSFSLAGTTPFKGRYEYLGYYDKRITDSQIITLTS